MIRALILLGLCAWAFQLEIRQMLARWISDVEWAHALAAPLAIIALFMFRKAHLTREAGKASLLGLLLLLGGFGLYAVSTWPLNFLFLRHAALIPVLGGVVLVAGGRGVFIRCLPILLIVCLSVPLGQRAYAGLSIKPETVTIKVARIALGTLPGVDVQQDGPDLTYYRDGETGRIGLGEQHRGASLLVAFLMIGVFVSFVEVRPFWQVVVLAAAAWPIVLLCNFLRFMTMGVVTIYTGAGPMSALPRNASIVTSLAASWLAFAVLPAVLRRLVMEEEDSDNLDAEATATSGADE